MKIDLNGHCTYLVRGGSFSGAKLTLHHCQLCRRIVLESHDGEMESYELEGIAEAGDDTSLVTSAEYRYKEDLRLI